jgi:hypothetical protein
MMDKWDLFNLVLKKSVKIDSQQNNSKSEPIFDGKNIHELIWKMEMELKSKETLKLLKADSNFSTELENFTKFVKNEAENFLVFIIKKLGRLKNIQFDDEIKSEDQF